MDQLEDVIPSDAITTLVFFVNGIKVVEPHPDPEWTLLYYLRRKLHLTGTKYGCGEGGCGACTVMLSHYDRDEDIVIHSAVNACLTPVCAVHGLSVTTIEGIGSTQDRLHAVQERIAKAHGSQCGFCTPGIVMSMYTLLRNIRKIEYNDIETALQGNLCRCTGYRPIIEGLKTFTESWEKQFVNDSQNKTCLMGNECCRVKTTENKHELFNKTEFIPHDPSQEPIFPPELKLTSYYDDSYLFFKGQSVTWIRPKKIEEILTLKKIKPEIKIVAGNTEVGVEMKFKKKVYTTLISPSAIKEIKECNITNTGIVIGALVTLSTIQTFLHDKVPSNNDKNKTFDAIKEMIHWFAGTQVRNVASLVGNIITASPISDLNPILMACSATINVCSAERGYRKILIDESFFEGYRKTAVKDDEVVISVEIPYTDQTQYVKAYKQAKRRDDDISIVTAAFNVRFDKNNNGIVEAKLCFGGMAPTTVCAIKTSTLLTNMQWNQNILQSVFDSLTNEFQLDISVPGGMADYRKSLCLSLFFKFYLFVLQNKKGLNGYRIPDSYLSAVDGMPVTEISSSQYFEIKDYKKKSFDAVGMPVIHTSATKQATGEAIYCDDLPHVEGELFLALVLSTESHARIKSIDASKAVANSDVVAFLCSADLDKERNKLGCICRDEEIFCDEVTKCRGCIIGAVVAKSEIAARKAKDLVCISYEPLQPVIISVEDAIAHASYFSDKPSTIKKGNVEKMFTESNNVIEGSIRSGAQEHFYLETISAFAIRKEDELEITATTQNPAQLSQEVAKALGIPNHKVVTKVKRIGGGFGGKETRSTPLAAAVAIAAYKLKKPIRAVLDREEDMQLAGYRHPMLIKYRAAFGDDGKISGALFNIYINAGYSMDISCALVQRVITHIDNCYFIPNVEVNAYLCKTNMPTNTAFRGFGAPKAMLAAEYLIRDIASFLAKPYLEIASKNLYIEGDLTHYNQLLTYCTLTKCWNKCLENSNYYERKKEVDEFNRLNRWKKKGISLVPTKYGISFQNDVLMQGGALLLIYNDGSVLLSIGGIEMGQGLFTKMIQVASRALEVDISKIHISEMATDKIPNSSATAASMSSDLYGMAVVNACSIMKDRLRPYKEKNPNGKWEDWVMAAYIDRVNLAVTGFYAAPKMDYDPETNFGNIFEYFTYGVACSEVIVDCLTGDHQVLRTDIVMDVGESLNPAIDIGQIEGAFTQGYGFYTMEEMIFSPSGEVLSRGPGTYKIPTLSDTPKVFNVSLLKGAPNPRAVYSSKAIGEPPLFLAASIFFAIREAIRSARLDAGVPPEFKMDVPATCARIRMACEDEITKKVTPTITQKGKPWNVIA